MKILVTKGMVGYNRKLYKTNQTVELDEAAGRRFIRLGVAVLLEETAADSAENEPVETVTPADEQDAEEETVVDLPTVDPTAVVKKGGRKKKATK